MANWKIEESEDTVGLTKRLLETSEADRAEAIDCAIAVGAVRRCPFHEEIVIDNYVVDLTDAYKVGNARFSRGESVFETRRELTDAIQIAVEEAHDSCPVCS